MINVNPEIIELNQKLLSSKKFEKLSDEVYIYRNFLSKEECLDLINEACPDPESLEPTYASKSLDKYRERLHQEFNYISQSNISEKNLDGPWDTLLLRFFDSNNNSNYTFSPHVDVYNFFVDYHKKAVIKPLDNYKEINLGHMSFIIYFSEDFEGGEIIYPEYGIEYKPKTGDMILHNVEVVHSVKKILSGKRWSYQSSIGSIKYIPENMFEKFMKDNDYYIQCRNEKNIENNPTFFYRSDQKPVFNERLKGFANIEGICGDS
jgi:hypothetical protein